MGVSDNAGGFSDAADEFASERGSGSERPRDAGEWGDETGEPFDDDSLDDDSLDSDALDRERDDVGDGTERETYDDELGDEPTPGGDDEIEGYEGYGRGGDEPSAEPGGDEAFEPAGQDETLHEVGAEDTDQVTGQEDEEGGQPW